MTDINLGIWEVKRKKSSPVEANCLFSFPHMSVQKFGAFDFATKHDSSINNPLNKFLSLAEINEKMIFQWKLG